MAEDARRFQIEQCLGSGGFGEVYLARMLSTGGVDTQVAVKVLHEGLDPRSQAVQRLRDEGRLLGRVNHPAVLKVRDLVMLEGRVALVMEYVPGLDLEGCFDCSPPISLRAGLEVCSRVAEALKAAYEAPGHDGTPLHLVHRDIKPSNIRVGKHGDVKLLDFGIAKATDVKREAKTQTRVTMGSPWYMAPERFDSVSGEPASDIYALGCTLFELVAGGTRLFEQLSAREHFLLALDPVKHAGHLAGHLGGLSLSDELLAVLNRMLAFEIADRPTAAELGPLLEDLSESVPGPALRKWVRMVAWPELPSAEGSLVGRVLTEHRISQVVGDATPVPVSLGSRPGVAAASETVGFGDSMIEDEDSEPPSPEPAPPEPRPSSKRATKRSPAGSGWVFGWTLIIGVIALLVLALGGLGLIGYFILILVLSAGSGGFDTGL